MAAAPGLQRARGTARAAFHRLDGRTRLARLHQAGCLKLRFPRLPAGPAEAVLIITAGGLTGGDALVQEFSVGAGAALSVTTQACERIYRASEGTAVVDTRIDIAEDAAFAWLPQETILFEGGRLRRGLDVECRASSRFLLLESVILGRQSMGESVGTGLLRDRWRIRRDGRLVFADDLRLSGAIAERTASAASLGGSRALVMLVAQRPDASERLRALRGELGDWGGASAVAGLLVVRLTAPSGFVLRKRLLPILNTLADAPLPRIWWS